MMIAHFIGNQKINYMRKIMRSAFLLAFAAMMIAVISINSSKACTRLVYKGPDNLILTGRSMDFSFDIPANLWIFPRGMQRNGEVGPNSIAWTSRYGSVIASSWDIASSDGMNEKGLVANMLWLAESEYPPFEKDGNKKGLTISAWAQYALDNFATVAEAVEAFREEEFVIVTDFIPGTDKFTTVHLSLSDAAGDNAILEYIGGKLVIHHDPAYTVMTNSPIYTEQLAVYNYWKNISGEVFLPGTNRASDRFARASYYLSAVPQTDNTRVAVATVMSIVRSVSVPYGIKSQEHLDLSSTQWRVVADHKNLVYYFETVLTPNTFWVDLKNIDFGEGTDARLLKTADGEVYSGEASGQFEAAAPFRFQGL
jgi:penicillin V acylase-like amidase (Ntn superfamily)